MMASRQLTLGGCCSWQQLCCSEPSSCCHHIEAVSSLSEELLVCVALGFAVCFLATAMEPVEVQELHANEDYVCTCTAQAGICVFRRYWYRGPLTGISCRPGTPTSFFSQIINLHHTCAKGWYSLYSVCNPKEGFGTPANIKLSKHHWNQVRDDSEQTGY